VTEETAARYEVHLRTIPGDRLTWPRSTLTPAGVERWLSGLEVAGPTKRKYFAALSSFIGYARSIGELTTDPLVLLSPPPAAAPSVEFLELGEVKQLLEACAEPERTLFAFLYGTGCDLSTALTLRRRDVELGEREVRARGTKSYNRDRIVTVAEWAWPHLVAHCKTLLPDAPLFPGLSRWTASDLHRAALTAQKLLRKGITLHAARHHWAVRALRAGTPVELVARQLGHKDGVLCLKVYGRFLPTGAERRKWEREATKQETRRERAR
jgi:integrase